MSGTPMGANLHSRVRRMARSGLGRQLDEEEELGLEEIGRSSEVANVIPSSTPGDIDLCNYLPAGDLPIDFTSVRRWKNICLQRCETTTMCTEYLVFGKVTKDDLVKIERSRRGMPIRLYYDSSMELLVVKLMIGKAHKWVGNLFADILREKVRSRCGDRRALSAMGAFRCTSAMGREKEPDVCLVPKNRNRELDWPSIVIEVGVSERLAALKNDALFWILDSGGLTRAAMLIAVDTRSKMITIERWGNQPPMEPNLAAGPILQPRMLQCVRIDTNGVVGAPLDVPSGLIFDVGDVPGGVLPSDFSFDANELVAFFVEFWGALT